MRIRITKPGIFGNNGEIEVGTEVTVSEEPTGWDGRYEIISGGSGDEGKSFQTGQAPIYAVKEKSRGWNVITKDGEEATKSLRDDAVAGFNDLTDDEKAAFVEANKPE